VVEPGFRKDLKGQQDQRDASSGHAPKGCDKVGKGKTEEDRANGPNRFVGRHPVKAELLEAKKDG